MLFQRHSAELVNKIISYTSNFHEKFFQFKLKKTNIGLQRSWCHAATDFLMSYEIDQRAF